MYIDDASDYKILSTVTFVTLILLSLGLLFMADSKVDASDYINTCDDLELNIEVIDATTLFRSLWDVEYKSDEWYAKGDELSIIFGELYYDRFSPSYAGTYEINSMWAVVTRVENGYRISSGTSWVIGSDRQLHNPTCYMLVHDEDGIIFEGFREFIYPNRR